MKLLMYSSRYFLIALMGLLFFHGPVMAQDSPTEEDYFKIMDVPSPEHHLLEVGGLTVLPNGDLGIATEEVIFLSLKILPVTSRTSGNLQRDCMKYLV